MTEAEFRRHLKLAYDAGRAADAAEAHPYADEPAGVACFAAGAGAFTAADAKDFGRYFAATDGLYPEHLHAYFGCTKKDFADHTGLVRKQVTAHRDGKTFRTWHWVRADEPPPSPASRPAHPAPAGERNLVPAPPGKAQRVKLAVADTLAKSRGGRAVLALGRAGIKLFHALEHRLLYAAKKCQELAAAAAAERGLPPERVEKLRHALYAADFVGGYATGAAALAVAGPLAGKVAAIMPSASVVYLAYSTAKNPLATWKAAKKVLAATLAGRAAAPVAHAADAGPEPDLAIPVGPLADALAAAADPDWFVALFCAALAHTRGDGAKALELASAAAQQPQPATFAAPGAPPRPGLVWKEQTHRWIHPETGEEHPPAGPKPATPAPAKSPAKPEEPPAGLPPELAAKVARRAPGAGGPVELSKEEVEAVLTRGVVGFVSAGRNPADPADAGLDDAAVAARYAELRAELAGRGYVFAPVRGHYGGEEDSFMVMVPDAAKDDVAELGRRFRQDSVIVSVAGKNHMLFTTGKNAGKEHAGEGFEYRPDAEDYYSEYCPAGEHAPEACVKFSLRFDFSTLRPKGFSEPDDAEPGEAVEMSAEEFAEFAAGLVKRTVTVHPKSGKPYRRTVMVRPEEAPKPAPAKKVEPQPAKKPAKAAPAAANKKGAAAPAKRTPPPKSDKALRAAKHAVRVDSTIQRYAEEYNEPRVAKLLGGAALPDSEPCDVKIPLDAKKSKAWVKVMDDYRAAMAKWEAGGRKGARPAMAKLAGEVGALVELKTLTVGVNDKLTMDKYAQARKVEAERASGADYHTIACDDRGVIDLETGAAGDEAKRVYYYRRGVAGSARIGTMYKCASEAELKTLMAMPEDELPEGARRTDAHMREGKWVYFEDAAGKGYKNSKSGEIARAKK